MARAPAPATPPVAPAAPGSFTNPLPALDTVPVFDVELAEIPTKSAFGRTSSTSKYPWSSLELVVGEDGVTRGGRFFIPGKTPKDVSGTISAARKSTGHSYSTYTGKKTAADGTVTDGVYIQRVELRPVQKRTPRKVAGGDVTATTIPANPPALGDGGTLPPPPPVDVPAPVPLPPVPPVPVA